MQWPQRGGDTALKTFHWPRHGPQGVISRLDAGPNDGNDDEAAGCLGRGMLENLLEDRGSLLVSGPDLSFAMPGPLNGGRGEWRGEKFLSIGLFQPCRRSNLQLPIPIRD